MNKDSQEETKATLKCVKIGICKGRTLKTNLKYLDKLGLKLELENPDDARCYKFKPAKWSLTNTLAYEVSAVVLSSRDIGCYLRDRIIDLAVGFDDTLHHLWKKNYHLKPLFPIDDNTTDARLCLVVALNGKKDPTDPRSKIVSEYEDAPHHSSSFRALSDMRGQWIISHGTSESMLANGFADFGVCLVESGETLKSNGLTIVREIRKLRLNIFANADTAAGFEFILHYRKDIEIVTIDGIDGSGKTSLIARLKEDKGLNKFIFRDRGFLSATTLLPWDTIPSDLPQPLGIKHHYLLLDCPVDIALERIQFRANETSSVFETKSSLSYFDFKFKELAAHYGPNVVLFDSTKTINELFCDVFRYLMHGTGGKTMPPMQTLIPMQLKQVAKGCSKIVYQWDDEYDIIQYIPSVYSHKAKRAEIIETTDVERLKMVRNVLYLLAHEQIPHTYLYAGKYVLARRLKSSPPPIEVVIKKMYVGTDKYRYVGLDQYLNRFDDQPIALSDSKHSSLAEGPVSTPSTAKLEKSYRRPYVRFDWRNSNDHSEGDVAMSDQLADELMDVGKARELALHAFERLGFHFAQFGIDIWDMCLFITKEGDYIFSEISQDNARYRVTDTNSPLDKDVFRLGGSSDKVLEKWQQMGALTSNYVDKFFAELYYNKT